MSKALTHRTEFYDVWRKFITTGVTEGIPDNIKESWKRCREMGFDPLKGIAPVKIDQEMIKKRIEEHRDLHDLLQSYYQDIEKKFDFAPFVIMFADAEGYILSILGHDKILRMLENEGLKAGVSANECYFGTSAPGITLHEGRSTTLIAEEHYYQGLHWASCFSTPIWDHQKNMLGCLDFTSTAHFGKNLEKLIPYFCTIAHSLQFDVFLKEKLELLELYDSYFHSTFEYADKILILVSRRGDIINLNTKAQTSFGITPLKNRNVRELLNIDISKFDSLLKKAHIVKLACPGSGSSKVMSIEAIPIFNQSGNEVAYLLKLEKEKTKVTIPAGNPNIAPFHFENIMGQSEQILGVIGRAKKVAGTSSNVLIEGETGTGKELFAQATHNESEYCHGPFVAINCCAIPHELIESELFGYERGAYTGARREGNIGKFELANGGTIFLDEIHAMDLSAQMKILRVIEDRQVTRVGGKYPISLNIRIIVASIMNLEDEVERGNFLSALFFRLTVVRLQIPGLRERKKDIPLLVKHFINEMNEKFSRSICGIESEALKVLSQYSWPGNVRELKNCIESAFNFCKGEVINLDDLEVTGMFTNKSMRESATGQTIDDITKNLLTESLKQFGNVKEAANSLGISVSTFYRKMIKFGLSK